MSVDLMPEGLARNREELFAKLRSQQETSASLGMCSDFSSWCDENGNFNPALLANDIVQNNEMKTDPASDVLYLYDYDKGVYDRNGDAALRRVIDSCLRSENRQRRTTEAIYLVHSKTQTEIQFSDKIAVENGLLNVKTRTLEAFTPAEFVTVKLPVRYDKKADCPNIKKFLSEVLEPDQIPIAQEMIGYCLLREYPIHTSFVLLGQGANGKTTFLNVINALLGTENCSHATLQQLCEGKFELAQLYGKLANICDDLPGEALKSVGNFKNLTGNAPIMAQFKHKNPFDFLNTAKPLWACNKLPAASEDTIAYYRRFVILQFNKYFIGSKADIKLIEKLITPEELSGLLNYALDGLERLLRIAQFSSSASVEETRQQYIRTADSCQAFIEEQTEPSLTPDPIPDDELYQVYVRYCQTNRLPIQKKAQLTISMQKYRPEAKHTNARINDKVTRVWQYVKFVATVASVATILLLSEHSEHQNYKKTEPLTTNATPATNPISERTCGQCALWHKPGCTFPEAEYSCVTPTNRHAIDCRDFMERERSP